MKVHTIPSPSELQGPAKNVHLQGPAKNVHLRCSLAMMFNTPQPKNKSQQE